MYIQCQYATHIYSPCYADINNDNSVLYRLRCDLVPVAWHRNTVTHLCSNTHCNTVTHPLHLNSPDMLAEGETLLALVEGVYATGEALIGYYRQ